MRTYLMGVLSSVILVPAALFGFLVLGFTPIHSDAKPSSLETTAMRFIVQASVRRHAVEFPPMPAGNEQAIIAGGKLYMQGCAGCHGELGKPFQEDRANFPPAPQLTSVGTQYSQAEVAWIIKHGIRMTSMSAYGRFYSADKLLEIATFVKSGNNLSRTALDLIRARDP